MSKLRHNLRISFLVGTSLLLIVTTLLLLANRAFAVDGWGGEGTISTVNGGYGYNVNCWEDSTCTHWILVDNNTLADAIANSYHGAPLTATEQAAVNTCTSSKNTTGKTVIAAHYNNTTGQLEFGNIHDDAGYNQRRKANHSTAEGFSFNSVAVGGKTYEQIMNTVMGQLGTNESGLSIFCAGMDPEVADPDPTPTQPVIPDPPQHTNSECARDTYYHTSPYSASGRSRNTGPLDPVDDTTVTFTHSFSLSQSSIPSGLSRLAPNWKLSSDIGSSSGTGWSAIRSGSKGISIGYSQSSSATLTYSDHATARRYKIYYWHQDRVPPYSETYYVTSTCYDSEGNSYSCKKKRTRTVYNYVKRCQDEHTRSSYTSWQWIGKSGSKSASTSSSTTHPYNFKLTSAMTSNQPDIVYAGEYASVAGTATLTLPDTRSSKGDILTVSHKNRNDGRQGTIIKLIQFTINQNVPYSSNIVSGGKQTVNNNNIDAGPCTYFRNKIGSNNIIDCADIKDFRDIFDPRYYLNGEQSRIRRVLSATPVIPDDDRNPIGTKYCVAVASYFSDSGSNGMENLPQAWNISGASCSTIAKKPTFQIWNNGLYTKGNINTSISPKVVDYKISDAKTYDNATKTIFGSWNEQLAIVGKKVTRFASGNTFGYNGWNFNLPGGHAYNSSIVSNSDIKPISPLTISNTNGNNVGSSNIGTTTIKSLLDRLKARYRPSEATGNTSFHGVFTNGVTVIHSNDTVTIDDNICYGECNGDHNDASTSLSDQNFSTNSVSNLPQVLIFAKNINIKSNVSRIDAWLIAEEGTINTCIDFVNRETQASGNCSRQLIINGPIFAKQLLLNRTAGANNGGGTHESGDVRSQNLSNDGSIAPAEIFNLRPDTYLWAYSQAQQFSEAVVTYSRELAPRL